MPRSSTLDRSPHEHDPSEHTRAGFIHMSESGTMPILDHFHVPSFLRSETLYRIYQIFEEELGCELECHRAIAALGASRDTLPRRLAGPLLIALSKKLHPERRTSFLRDACRALADYEGTPCVLV